MLLEMASGNFFYRLERSANNDNIEALTVSLNMLAEEIQGILLHQGYANINDNILDIVQMSFILDSNGHIEATNRQTSNILSILHKDLIGKPFGHILNERSKLKWETTLKSITQKEDFDTSIELEFKTKGNLLLPKVCYISSFEYINNQPKKIMVSIIHHTTSHKELEKSLKARVVEHNKEQSKDKEEQQTDTKPSKIRLSFDDIRKLRKGHDIIINNLDKDLPSLKEFALQLGTNEFKLKYGFKELYGMPVHRYLMQERLRKSNMLIQHTDKSLKSIAHMTGFKSMPHFSRAFKKHFGYTPSELRKENINSDK